MAPDSVLLWVPSPQEAGGGTLAGLQHDQNRSLVGDSSKTPRTGECGDKSVP